MLLPSHVAHGFTNQTLRKVLGRVAFYRGHVLPTITHALEIRCANSSRIGWLPYFLAEEAAAKIESFAVLARN